ncbi:hypothetical protein JCM16303_004336 [Sporobolomyces ruberrimus]
MTTQRSLGLYERYALAMSGLGHAPAVAVSCLLPTSSGLNSTNLLAAITALHRQEPHLRSEVTDSRTIEPKFYTNDDIEPERVLVERIGVAHSAEQALLDAMEELVALDVTQAPLWRVWTYEADPETNDRRLVVGIHHLLADGTAAKNLFTDFLALLRSPSSREESNDIPCPPTLESTIDLRPSWRTLLRTGLSEFVLPKLPSFLRPRTVPCWPNPAVVPPIDQPTATKLFFLDSNLASSLSSIPKSLYNVQTLHPTLLLAAVTAISNTVLSTPNSPQAVDVVSQTPISLRSPSLSHPFLCSNYVTTIPHLLRSITPSYLSSTSFWSLTRSIATHLRSPTQLQLSKESLGMLAYVSPGDPHKVLSEGEKTEWENWLEGRMKGNSSPWKGSLEFSNLGRIDRRGEIDEWLHEGMKEVCWAQPASCGGNALQFNAISCGGLLSVSLTWRKDAIDQTVVDTLWRSFEAILTKIARGEVTEETTLADLVK